MALTAIVQVERPRRPAHGPVWGPHLVGIVLVVIAFAGVLAALARPPMRNAVLDR